MSAALRLDHESQIILTGLFWVLAVKNLFKLLFCENRLFSLHDLGIESSFFLLIALLKDDKSYFHYILLGAAISLSV